MLQTHAILPAHMGPIWAGRIRCPCVLPVPCGTVFRPERCSAWNGGNGSSAERERERERRNGGNGAFLLSLERRACWNGDGTGTRPNAGTAGTGTMRNGNTENGNGNGNGETTWDGSGGTAWNGNGAERRRARKRRAGTITETGQRGSGTRFLFREQEPCSASALFRLRVVPVPSVFRQASPGETLGNQRKTLQASSGGLQ